MTLVAVMGAVASLIVATANGVAILPRPGLPLVGNASPIAALPVAALIALEAAVLLGVLQNGGRAVTLDEWKRLVDKDNYDIVYDYDYGKPFRKLIYHAASAPDDSESYFTSEEEGEGHHRRISESSVPPFSYYEPSAYSQPQHGPVPHNQRGHHAPYHRQASYPHPGALPYRRYKRDLQGLATGLVLEELTQATEDLQKEEDEKVVEEAVKDLTGEVMKLDRDGCLMKLLCHLQKKPKDTRDQQDNLMLSLFRINVSGEVPKCGQEFKCPVEEKQLVEAFAYTWQLQNTV